MKIKFETQEQAQSYADKVHNYLIEFGNEKYIAKAWDIPTEQNEVSYFAAVTPDADFQIVEIEVQEEQI